MLLEGKTVVVSGVGTGLGREIALAATREGANVVLGARTEANLKSVAEEIGERAAYAVTDILDKDACGALIALGAERFGGVDAGGAVVFIGTQSSFHPQLPQSAYATSKGALYSAMFSLARELGPKKIRVNMVVPTWMWGPNVQLYVALTAQQKGVSEDEVKAKIAAKMPLGEIPEDADVANAAVFFASDNARMLTGQTLFVNGGEYFR